MVPAVEQPKPVSTLSADYQLRLVQEVLLALLAKEPSHAYQLRARLSLALGPLSDALNDGQVYVTLARLEKAGLLSSARAVERPARDRRIYTLTAAGRDRLASWIDDTSWPKPAPAEFHLKLVAAAAANLADPVGLVDRQRRELLTGLREAQRAALAQPERSAAALLLEGVVLRLQADLRWLERCAEYWTAQKGPR
jgi:DNA-binding PadR family transcriptional regulator